MDRMMTSQSSPLKQQPKQQQLLSASLLSDFMTASGSVGGARTRSSSLAGSNASGSNPNSPSKGSNKARKTNSLPLETVEYLKAWMMSPEHVAHPYPTEQEKAKIMADTGIELKQLTNWFVNNRKRFWKPRVEGRLPETQPGSIVVTAGAIVTPTIVTPLKSVDASGIITLSEFSLGSGGGNNIVSGFLEPQTSRMTSKMTPSSSSSSLNSPARVSDQSISSESDSVYSSSDEDNNHNVNDADTPALSMGGRSKTTTQWLTQTELVNVHILRPPSENNVPTLNDVVILHNVPSDRVLTSFLQCPLTYQVPIHAINDTSTIQSRRDAEIIKLKAMYLNQFLSTPLNSCSSPSKRPRFSVVEHDDTELSFATVPASVEDNNNEEEQHEPMPRRKYRRASLDVWREACTQSRHFYDRQLPTLEEAATLFGFATS